MPVLNRFRADRRRTPGVAPVAAVLAVALAGHIIAVAADAANHVERTNQVVGTVANGITLAVGAMVALSVPGNLIGRLLLSIGVLTGVSAAFTETGAQAVLDHPGSTAGAYAVMVGVTLRALPSVLLIGALPGYFPDGRLPKDGWRWVRWALIAAVAFTVIGGVIAPIETRLGDHWHGPLTPAGSLGDQLQIFDILGTVLTIVAGAGGVAVLVSRWRRGGAIVRQQILLFACAAAITVLFLVTVLAIVVLVANNGAPDYVFSLAELPAPVAVAMATLNSGLYDLRRAANRTVSALLMSVTIAAVYVVVVVAVTAAAPDRNAWWPPALAATAAALALVPLRDRLQRVVQRVVYGRWHEPYEVLSELGERLEAAADIDRLLESALAQLGEELDLRDLSVRDVDGRALAGVADRADQVVPVQAYGTPLGTLSFASPDRPLSEAEHRLIRDLARHIGATLHARALITDLQRTRERLVVAREEERRRLRRDLHDGIGPALAGLTLKAETAQALLPPDAPMATQQLRDLTDEIRAMVVEVRRVVEGLRPPALDDLGLEAATRQAVARLTQASSTDATVEIDGDLSGLPAAAEVAAFRIVQEAVTNVVRHAGAQTCHVLLASSAGLLAVTVTDDGSGLTVRPSSAGNGLATMRERAEELGGSLLVVSEPAQGVQVRATLPTRVLPARTKVTA